MDLDTQMYFHLLRNLLTKNLKMIKKSLRNLFHRLLTNWKSFSQVSGGKFPLNNIAFQLWCDVVDWYENIDTRQMRYSPKTLQFF